MTDDKFTRRDFLKASLAGSSALAAPTIINCLGESSPSSDKEFLEVRDGNFYMGGDEYTIKGANYLTRDHPHRMFHEYDPEQINKELEIASNLGINTVRVPIKLIKAIGHGEPYAEPIDHNRPEEDYFNNFEDFLGLADKHDIKVMPVALDWVYYEYFNPKNFHLSEEYLEDWLPEFKDDERILAWDAKNEPNLIEDTTIKEQYADKWKVAEYTRKMADKIRSLDSNHPVTVGLHDTFDAADWSEGWQKEFRENAIEELPNYINHEDFYSFHFFWNTKALGIAVDKIKEQTDKPIVLQEFGLPTTGKEYRGEEDQESYYGKILEQVMEDDLAGVMFWELNDHPQEAMDKPNNEAAFHWGVLRNDHSKKPAAHVVQQYYKWIL